MNLRRAVITGIGAVTPAGIGWEKNWEALLAGRSGINSIKAFPTQGYRTTIAGEVDKFEPQLYMEEKLGDNTERFSQFAIAATQQALKDSHLEPGKPGLPAGVVVGCGMGGLPFFETQAGVYGKRGVGFIRPSSVPRIMTNAAGALIASLFKVRGPNLTVSTACSSSNHAAGVALDWIRSGRSPMVICGGTESLLSPITFGAFDSLRVMSNRNDTPKKACRPFDKDRDGFVMGEGSVMFLIEELDHARHRRASIYAELAGYGASNGSYNMLAPEPDGKEASESMTAALRDAELRPEEVDFIHAHGTATRNNDEAESRAVHLTFKTHAQKLAVTSTKGITGHMLGAAGAMGILASALALQSGKIPATLNFDLADPSCDLDIVSGKARTLKARVALANAFAFGGNNATVVLKQKEESW
jgi:3-oxoacyl-[acyl-carrier-protein] synthase II